MIRPPSTRVPRPSSPDIRWAAALLVVSTALAASALAAQACTAVAPLLQRPTVRIAVAIDGCDYLGALAEARHVTGAADCDAIRSGVRGDSTSRVHALSRTLADSLRPVFAHQFGFLTWTTSPNPAGWSATVSLNQLHRGADGNLRVVLRSPDGEETASEAFDFDPFVTIEHLYHASKTPASLDSIRGRWTTAIVALLERNDGFNRSKLVRSVFRKIRIATLTPAEVRPFADGSAMRAPVRIRDSDISVKSPNRPIFEWQVQKVERGQPPVEDEGVFLLGECAGMQGYSCKMLRLRHGAALFEGNQVGQFFGPTTVLHAPIGLHIVEYRPASSACSLRGVIP